MKPLILRKRKYRTAAPMERQNNFIRTTKQLAAEKNRQVLIANEKEQRT